MLGRDGSNPYPIGISSAAWDDPATIQKRRFRLGEVVSIFLRDFVRFGFVHAQRPDPRNHDSEAD